jgi:hypothetical protein
MPQTRASNLRLLGTIGAALLASQLAGCASGIALYDGPERPAGQVARVKLGTDLVDLDDVEPATGPIDGQRVPKKPKSALWLPPGHTSFHFSSAASIVNCQLTGIASWKLTADLQAGQSYEVDLNVRVFSLRVDSSGSGCPSSASVGPVILKDSNGKIVATGEAVPQNPPAAAVAPGP